jgi:hypothetical protein
MACLPELEVGRWTCERERFRCIRSHGQWIHYISFATQASKELALNGRTFVCVASVQRDAVMKSFVPSSSQRVQGHTPVAIRHRNRRLMLERLRACEDADPAELSERIAQLEREWDIERVLEANAASVALIGLALGATVNRRWFALPAVVAGFLLQHAVQGWCPPLPLFGAWASAPPAKFIARSSRSSR